MMHVQDVHRNNQQQPHSDNANDPTHMLNAAVKQSVRNENRWTSVPRMTDDKDAHHNNQQQPHSGNANNPTHMPNAAVKQSVRNENSWTNAPPMTDDHDVHHTNQHKPHSDNASDPMHMPNASVKRSLRNGDKDGRGQEESTQYKQSQPQHDNGYDEKARRVRPSYSRPLKHTIRRAARVQKIGGFEVELPDEQPVDPSPRSEYSHSARESQSTLDAIKTWEPVKKPQVNATGRRGAIWDDFKQEHSQREEEVRKWRTRNPANVISSVGIGRYDISKSNIKTRRKPRPSPDFNAILQSFSGKITWHQVKDRLKARAKKQGLEDATSCLVQQLEKGVSNLLSIEEEIKQCEAGLVRVKESEEKHIAKENRYQTRELEKLGQAKLDMHDIFECVLQEHEQEIKSLIGQDKFEKYCNIILSALPKECKVWDANERQCCESLIHLNRVFKNPKRMKEIVLGALLANDEKYWHKLVSKDDRVFWYCEASGERTWARPLSVRLKEAKDAKENLVRAKAKLEEQLNGLFQQQKEILAKFEETPIITIGYVGYKKLPSALGLLKSARILFAPCNKIESISSKLVQGLHGIVSVHLEDNALTTLCDEIGQLSALENLVLSRNKLKRLPESIGTLKRLQVLEADQNLLVSIPSCFRELGRLKVLNLGRNKLTQLEPSALPFKSLEYLCVNGNLLKGSVRFHDVEFQRLRSLKLDHNVMQAISFGISLPELEFLGLENNKLKAFELVDDAEFPVLETLQLQHNLLVEIPTKMRFPCIKCLNFQSNEIRSLDPLLNGELAQLGELYIGHNKISHIPCQVFCQRKLPKLTMLALNHNNLQAVTVKHGIHELVSLQTLKLQDNALKSIDPDAIPRCCVSINLSRNNLSCPEAVLKLVKRRSQLSSLVLVGNTALLSNPNAQQQLRRAADRPQFNLKLS